jgi:hypothetical protein
MSKSRDTHWFELKQNGLLVAGGTGKSLAAVVRECCHYVFMYSQDGPVTVTGSGRFMQEFKKVHVSEEYLHRQYSP